MTDPRTSLWALISALGVLLFQMMNVAQVGQVGHTLFGTTSQGVWVSTPELFLLVVVAYLLGELAAAGIILTSLALSFAVTDPVLIGATIGSKIISLGAVAIVERFGLNMLWAMLVALEVDVFAFALWARLPQIIITSLILRLVLWLSMLLIVKVTPRSVRHG